MITPNNVEYSGPQNLINLTLFYNSLSCGVPDNYLSNQTLSNLLVNNLSNTILVVSGNRFNSKDKNIFSAVYAPDESHLPQWVDPNERSSQLYTLRAMITFKNIRC